MKASPIEGGTYQDPRQGQFEVLVFGFFNEAESMLIRTGESLTIYPIKWWNVLFLAPELIKQVEITETSWTGIYHLGKYWVTIQKEHGKLVRKKTRKIEEPCPSKTH